MKQWGRWIWFGAVALVLIIVLVFVGANKKLRQQIEALLLERFVKNKVNDLEDKAIVIKTRAEMNEISAKEAEEKAGLLDKKIKEQKSKLEKGLKLLKTITPLSKM